MRRAIVIIAVVAAALSVSAPAGALSPSGRLNREVTGHYSGRQTFEFGVGGCGFVEQRFDITYKVKHRHRRGSLHVVACVIPTPPDAVAFTYEGTFTLTTPRRQQLAGTVTGSTNAAVPTATLELTLTVQSGTGKFQHAVGSIAVSGTWSNDPGVLGQGPTNGTLAGHLHFV
jgi:hypothetical protein